MRLSELGWTDFFATVWHGADGRAGQFPARVIEEHKNAWRLASERGEFPAQAAGRLRHHAQAPADFPVVGDWVAAAEGVICAILPRHTRISRRAAGKRTDEQIIAANVDTVFVVTSLNREYNPRRLERYLTLVSESGARPVVILNKADLCEDSAAAVRETRATAPGVSVHPLSARTGAGLDELAVYLGTGQTVALVGSSGVGKSTLINRLTGVDGQAVKAVLDDDRGRHTTTARSLVALSSGGLLIDTPGMRELQLWATGEGLQSTFEEFEELSAGCRFRDCRHVTEPGCAVLSALGDGQLQHERYESYLKLRSELAHLDRKRDVAAQLAEKRKWKEIHRAQKEMQRTSRKRF